MKEIDLSEPRSRFGGSAKVPDGTVAVLRSNDRKRTFAMQGPGGWTKGQMNGLNDEVQNLWVAPGYELKLFKDQGFSGESRIYHYPPKGGADGNLKFQHKATHLWTYPNFKHASSCQVRYAGYSESEVVVCFLRPGTNYADLRQVRTVIPGDYARLRDSPFKADDELDWILASSGVVVEAYEHSDFRGKLWPIQAGFTNLRDLDAENDIGSIKVILPNWELVRQTPLWHKASEKDGEQHLIRARVRNESHDATITQSMELSDEEGDEHTIEWGTGVESCVTVGCEVNAGILGAGATATMEASLAISADYGESNCSVRTEGCSASLEIELPPRSSVEGSMLLQKKERTVPFEEIWRDPATGREVSRIFNVVSKRGMNPSTTVKDVPL